MVSRFDISTDDLADMLADEPSYRVRQVWDGLYSRGVAPEAMTNLPLALRDRLIDELPLALEPLVESVSDDGETVKWLWGLHDGAQVETVLMHYPGRTTVCVSSQAGCAMACSFCATGQAGFERHLSVGEILEQVIRARAVSAPRRVSNIVFMGMGEPLANYDRVWQSIERLHTDVGLSARNITVSTVGLVPGIRRLATEALPVNLAVSLHLADDERRNELVPINRRYPLDELADACQQYLAAKGRRISFEWALIDGVNDTDLDARQLAAYARPLRAHVNLIPLNPTPGYLTQGTPPERVAEFSRLLGSLGVNATVRRNRGTDIDAACGQLRAATRAKAARERVASAPVPSPRRRS